MKNLKFSRYVTASFFAALFSISAIFAQDKKKHLLPSEGLVLMVNAVDMHPEMERIEATKPFLSRVITSDLPKEEQFYLGEVYFWNFMPDQAMKQYSKFLDGNDDYARASWQRAMQINFRAYEKHDLVEKQLKQFRKKFKAVPADRSYGSGQTYNLGAKYAKENKHERVLSLVHEELSSLDFEGAYASYQLPAYFFTSFKALDKEEEALRLLKEAKKGLEETLEKRKMNMPERDADYAIHTSRVRGMETIVTDKMGYSQINQKFEELINSIEKAIIHFEKKA